MLAPLWLVLLILRATCPVPDPSSAPSVSVQEPVIIIVK